MGGQDPIKDAQVRETEFLDDLSSRGGKPRDPKSHDPEADRETAWNGRDRFEPAKPGDAPASDQKAVPRAHPI